jgi:hypothetical protein
MTQKLYSAPCFASHLPRVRVIARQALCTAGGCALLFAGLSMNARADTIQVEMVDAPNRSGTACNGLVTADLDNNGRSELYEAGPSIGAPFVSEAVISRLGPIVGGRLQRSNLVVPTRKDQILALLASPPPVPRLFVFGNFVQFGTVQVGVDVFSGPGLRQDYTRAFQPFNSLTTAAVANVVSSTQFRFAGGAFGWLGSYASQQQQPLWTLPRSTLAVVQAQVDGDAAPEWIASWDGALEIYDSETGVLEGSVPTVAYRSLVAVNLDSDPQLELVAVRDGTLATFELSPPSLRWSRTADFVRTAVAFDRDGDGVAEILSATDDFLRWVDASGAPQENSAVDARGIGFQIALVDVTGDGVADVVHTNGFFCGGGITVRSQNLANVLGYEAPERGPFDRLAVGNLDADAADEIVTLSAGLPSETSTPGGTKVRVVDAASGIEQWQATVPGSTQFDIDELRIVELAQGDADSELEIFAYGSFVNRGGEGVVTFDGDGRLLRRTAIPVGADRRLVGASQQDVDADGVMDLVVVTGAAFSDGVGLRIALHDATTLARRWQGPVFSGGFEIRFLQTMQLDSDPSLEAVVGVDGVGVFAFDLGTRLLQWNVPMESPRSIAPGPGVPMPWLAIAQPDRLTRVAAADGVPIDVHEVDFFLRGIGADPLDDSYVVLAADERFVILDLGTGTVTASSRDITRNLAVGGAVIQRVSAGAVRWYAGNNAGVWSATVTREPARLFADGFEDVVR